MRVAIEVYQLAEAVSARPALFAAAFDKHQLVAYVRQHLAPYKAPRHWFAVDAFPLTGSGKIQKYKLREMLADGHAIEL